MLIFHYISIGIIAFGALITAVGIAYALSYNAVTNAPPSSQEDEYERTRMGGTAAVMVLVGLLLCGVGFLFR